MPDEAQSISKLRLSKILEAAVEGEPDYWYGVVDGFSGALWGELFVFKYHAEERAKQLQGHVVIVAASILEDEEGEHIEPEN